MVLLEAGGLVTSSDFRLEERQAYRDLYQEGTGRATKDGAIAILQGRTVGGSTTVNWTSSFRTPEPTLAYWAERMGVTGCSPAELAPWFARMEERLGRRAADERVRDRARWGRRSGPRVAEGLEQAFALEPGVHAPRFEVRAELEELRRERAQGRCPRRRGAGVGSRGSVHGSARV